MNAINRAGIVDIAPAPGPDMGKISISMGEDGLATIEIGSNQEKTRKRAKNEGFDANLAENISEGSLNSLAAYLLEGIEADIQDRAEWLETVDMAADYLGIKLTNPASSVAADGTICQAVATCMLRAAIKLWGTAYGELLPTDGPVKVSKQDIVPVSGVSGAPSGGIMGHNGGPALDPTETSDGAGDDLADALERDMNWYLTSGDKGYYPDFSKMLMNRALIGLAFREVYRCPVERKPLSRWIMAQDLIVSGSPAHVGEVGLRVTARKRLSQSLMKRLQKTSYYLDVVLAKPTGKASNTEIVVGGNEGVSPTGTLPRDYEHEVYECNCELGVITDELGEELGILEQDETGEKPGYPLPYRVTIDSDSRQVLRIERNWKKKDKDHKPRRRYVKYGFLPAFGGGFYDWGLLHIAGNPTQAATMIQRACVDASILANFPAWMVAKGAGSRMDTTVFRPGPGDAVPIPTTAGMKLSDVIMPWPYKEASPQAMAMIQKLEQDINQIAGVVEIPVGEGRLGNTPVGTIMSYIESVSMVPGAVHKSDHVAQAEEFEMLRELMAEEPEVLWRGNKNPARKWRTREELTSPNLAPKGDPNTPSQIHRLLKIQGMLVTGGLPQMQGIANNRAIYMKAMEVLSGVDAAEYTMPEQPPTAAPPDPKILAAQIKAQSELAQQQQKAQEAQMEHQSKMQEIQAESRDKAADRDAANQREMMKLAGQKIKSGADVANTAAGHAHDAQQAHADRVHDVGLAAMDHSSTTQQQMTAPLTAPDTGDTNV